MQTEAVPESNPVRAPWSPQEQSQPSQPARQAYAPPQPQDPTQPVRQAYQPSAEYQPYSGLPPGYAYPYGAPSPYAAPYGAVPVQQPYGSQGAPQAQAYPHPYAAYPQQAYAAPPPAYQGYVPWYPQPQPVIVPPQPDDDINEESFFYKARIALPVLPVGLAIIAALMNIVPGLGTAVGGIFTIWAKYYHRNDKTACVTINLIVGAAQFALAFFFLFGWIWAIIWSILFLIAAWEYRRPRPHPLDAPPPVVLQQQFVDPAASGHVGSIHLSQPHQDGVAEAGTATQAPQYAPEMRSVHPESANPPESARV